MQYFVLGLAAVVVVIVSVRLFTGANPASVTRFVRLFGGMIAAVLSVALIARGLIAYALPLVMLASWLFSSGSMANWGGTIKPSPGRSSRIVTDYLEMELDLDSGAISGRVLKGSFEGREIEALAPAEMAMLWQDCRFADPQSAQILEAYLDSAHPSWREDMARTDDAGAGADQEGMMTPSQAYEILGLKPGASADDIRYAHRELMLKMHPDRGGSTYLAAKINEAKEVLLGRAG